MTIMRYQIFLFFITLGLLMSSCSEDFLDVQNVNQLSQSSFYQTEQDFEYLLTSCYLPIGYTQQAGGNFRLGFAIDDRVLHEQANTSALQYNATNEDISRIYVALYMGVFRSNLFLKNFTEEIEMGDEARRQTLLGEAHFLRGMYYFYLATYFEVPPLLTEPAENPLEGYPNATQEELYAFVEAEFTTAMDLLPVQWAESELGRATKGAAMSFLGRTYLYQGKFAEAADILGQVINAGTYALNMPQGTDSLDYVWAYLANFSPVDLPNGNKVYRSEFNSESIYDINYSLVYDEGARASQFLILRRSTGGHMTWYNGYSAITGGFGNVAMEGTEFPQQFERPTDHPAGLAIDPRYYAIFIEDGDTLDFRADNPLSQQVFKSSFINGSLETDKGLRKYLYPFHTSYTWPNAPFQDPNNFRLIRYADVLLMYAEAQVRATNNPSEPTALAAFNQVRTRAGMPTLTTLDKNAIIHERDIELAGELLRFWDLSRWYKDGWLDLSEVQAFLPNFQPRHTAFPIPQSEIDRHYGTLLQNPSWR
jgi:tetratricopeptide (TPR) repeat protein